MVVKFRDKAGRITNGIESWYFEVCPSRFTVEMQEDDGDTCKVPPGTAPNFLNSAGLCGLILHSVLCMDSVYLGILLPTCETTAVRVMKQSEQVEHVERWACICLVEGGLLCGYISMEIKKQDSILASDKAHHQQSVSYRKFKPLTFLPREMLQLLLPKDKRCDTVTNCLVCSWRLYINDAQQHFSTGVA
ncbi:hypothetical protein L7F22_048244 [Adiantum nelumboides]|nr:hypothetical protein [Adiantum nelumboides]